ncbi:hypothetical protein D3C78_1698650 [compost metagenome]
MLAEALPQLVLGDLTLICVERRQIDITEEAAAGGFGSQVAREDIVDILYLEVGQVGGLAPQVVSSNIALPRRQQAGFSLIDRRRQESIGSRTTTDHQGNQ